MLTKPSTALCSECNMFSEFCDEKLDLREKLLASEANRLSGAKTYTIEEVSEKLRGLLEGSI